MLQNATPLIAVFCRKQLSLAVVYAHLSRKVACRKVEPTILALTGRHIAAINQAHILHRLCLAIVYTAPTDEMQ